MPIFRFALTAAFLSLTLSSGFSQQVLRKVLVTHFTNTRCSICASRNPDFKTNFVAQNNNDMMLLAFHPSAPYPTCIFNQHNVDGNDDYAFFMQVYGGTPRIAINGNALPASASYSDPTMYDPYKNLTSPIALSLQQQKFGSDSIRIRMCIKAVDNNAIGNQRVYLGVAESDIAYNAPNGEPLHHRVFRQFLLGNQGTSFDIPAMTGDSITYTVTIPFHFDWNVGKTYAFGYVQNGSTREVYQAEETNPSQQDQIPMSVAQVRLDAVKVFPNPAQNVLQIISNTNAMATYKVFDLKGKLYLQDTFTQHATVNISAFHKGAYFVVVETDRGTTYKRVLKL